jgi:hypothetical protein
MPVLQARGARVAGKTSLLRLQPVEALSGRTSESNEVMRTMLYHSG